MLKCKSAVSYASNVSKYTEWKQQDSEHTVFYYIYKKELYIYAYITHLPQKKTLGRIIANSSSSWKGRTEGREKANTDTSTVVFWTMYKHYNCNTIISKSSHLWLFHKQLKISPNPNLKTWMKSHPTENIHNKFSSVLSVSCTSKKMFYNIHTAHLQCIFKSIECKLKKLP